MRNGSDEFGWGVVVNFQKKANQSKAPQDNEPVFIVEVLLHLTKESAKSGKTSDIKPCPLNEKGEIQVRSTDYSCIKIL